MYLGTRRRWVVKCCEDDVSLAVLYTQWRRLPRTFLLLLSTCWNLSLSLRASLLPVSWSFVRDYPYYADLRNFFLQSPPSLPFSPVFSFPLGGLTFVFPTLYSLPTASTKLLLPS